MIDIVIPLGKSRIDYLDLRYVLRSIEKFGQNAGDIYLIGEKPKWATGIRHIPMEDVPKKHLKERNIYNKVLKGFEYTDSFIMFNDDHVLLQPVDLEKYPNYYKGTCHESMIKNASHYRQTMNQTRKWLAAHGFEDLNYDGHCPVIMERDQFIQVNGADWSAQFGYGLKSLYCAGLEGVYMTDKKLHTRVNLQEAIAACNGRHVVSFSDAAVRTGLGEYFEMLLPNKSKYELC